MALGHGDPLDSMMMGSGVTMDLTRKPADKDAVSLSEAAEGIKPKVKPVIGGKIDQQNAQVFDPTTVIPRAKPRDKGVDEMFGALDAAVENEKQDISRRMKDLEAAMYEEHINGEAYKDEATDPDYVATGTNNGNTEGRRKVGELTAKQAAKLYGQYNQNGNTPFSQKQIDEIEDDEDLKQINFPKAKEETQPMEKVTVEEKDDDILPDKEKEQTFSMHKDGQQLFVPAYQIPVYQSIGWTLDNDSDPDEYPDDEEEEEKPEPEPNKPETFKIASSADENDYEEDDDIEKDIEDSDRKAAEERENQEKEMQEIVDGLKSETKKVLGGSVLDLSKYTIGDTKIKASSLVIESNNDHPDIADWCLYNAGKALSASGLSGPELIRLDPENTTRNRANTLRDNYRILYDHIIDSKKPDFDTWMKQTSFSDLDHIYFTVYQATFHGSNFVSYQCPDCKKVFIKDVPFKDMVKYKNEEVEKKVKNMVQQDSNNGKIKYNIDLIPAGNRYVFGMKRPSLYNIVMETAGLPDEILEKYADLIDTIIYIDSVYVVDNVNMKLNPVQIPVVKGDPVKSTAKRIRTLNDILKRLSSDEYYALRGYISNANNDSEDVTYLTPEAECPDCGKKIDAIDPMGASDLLFTRHHLGAFASM